MRRARARLGMGVSSKRQNASRISEASASVSGGAPWFALLQRMDRSRYTWKLFKTFLHGRWIQPVAALYPSCHEQSVDPSSEPTRSKNKVPSMPLAGPVKHRSIPAIPRALQGSAWWTAPNGLRLGAMVSA